MTAEIVRPEVGPDPTDEDLACAQCGYNLRTLPRDSVCPECGRRIADTLATAPVTAWLPGFRRGLSCLALAWVALPFAELWIWSDYIRIGSHSVNRDGLAYVAQGLLFFPAAWWMTRPADFLRHDPGRLRRLLLFLNSALVLGGGLAIGMFYQPGYWHSLVLLTLYGLIPLAFVAEVLLVVGVVIEATAVLPKPPPRRVLRAIQAALLYSLLGPALIMALVSAARIGQLSQPFVPRDTYLPRALNTLLDNVLGWPAFVMRRPLWLVSLGMILYCRVALRRGVLPAKTGLSGRFTMG